MTSNPLFQEFMSLRNTLRTIEFADISDLIVNGPKYYSTWWTNLYKESPHHIIIETSLVIFIIWLLFIRRTVDPSKTSRKTKLTRKEEDWLVETWEPEPLIQNEPNSNMFRYKTDESLVIRGIQGNQVTLEGYHVPILNLSSFDFLGMSQVEKIKEKAKEALDKYGVGSCGPRGFYGTIDQHLLFESALSKFMGTEEAISYSDGASAISSTIPAFSKKGDLLIVDEACCEAITTGLNLSRSTVQYFKHNDMGELATILKTIAEDDIRLNRDTTQQRRFIVIEGIYRYTGDICNLPEVLKLAEQFKYRVILDESISFGTMGNTGRGITEHFGLKVTDVDMIIISMETTLASVGGACVGTREIVDHQRLSGAGYCFSASAPPFLSAAAIKSLEHLEEQPALRLNLLCNIRLMREGLNKLEGFAILTSDESPIIHLVLSDVQEREKEQDIVTAFVRECVTRGVGIVASKHSNLHRQLDSLRPTVRICITASLSGAEISLACTRMRAAAASIFKQCV